MLCLYFHIAYQDTCLVYLFVLSRCKFFMETLFSLLIFLSQKHKEIQLSRRKPILRQDLCSLTSMLDSMEKHVHHRVPDRVRVGSSLICDPFDQTGEICLLHCCEE